LKRKEAESGSAARPKDKTGRTRRADLPPQFWQAGNSAISRLLSQQGSGQPLDRATRALMESCFGQDFSQVRVRADADAAKSARAIGARAFTVGQEIVFGQGQYAPETSRGKELLAHELAHIVQQSRRSGSGAPNIHLEGEAHAAGIKVAAHQSVSVQGATSGPAIQMAPEEEKKLPAAVVTTTFAEILAQPDAKAARQDTLKQHDPVKEVIEKRKVGESWWYKIRYQVGEQEKTGWSLGENFSELASPETFKFETPGATGVTSPFEKLRKGVAKEKLEPNIARLINFLNVLVLPAPGLTLPDFVVKSFYHALVEAKGNFKRASLLMTGAIRAFKPSAGGSFPWVQAKITPSSGFDPATFRDKVWHFFWNAYERFDGASAAWLDFKGVAYELKSRSSPVSKLFKLEPLSRDAAEDVAFNRGGIAFADWVMQNDETVIKHHYSEIEMSLREAIKGDPELSKLKDSEIDEVITRALKSAEVETEVKKRCYMDFAEYAARHIELVLAAVKKLPAKFK
jgi:hypothetical protein